MRRCYFSRMYADNTNGGNKAKIDFEIIMESMGFENLGFGQRIEKGKVKGFFYDLFSIIKVLFSIRKDDLLVIQYPLRKYYTIVASVAAMKGAKVIALIIDLGAYRRKKLTAEQEKKKLASACSLIVISEQMKAVLLEQNYTQDIQVLEMWDFMIDKKGIDFEYEKKDYSELLYVGGLSIKKHSFMYKMDEKDLLGNIKFQIFGQVDNDNPTIKSQDSFVYHGLAQPEDIVSRRYGDFGLVWYGHSFSEIDGVYGEYLKITVSGKCSLYMHAHIPLIVWSESAYADFVRKHNIGICVESLENLHETISAISVEEYNTMRENTKKISQMLSEGFFFKRAFAAIETNIKQK